MESNKDEAERCIEIAEGYLNAGNHEKAEKFLLKAEKLYSTKKAKDILESLVRLKSRGTPKNADSEQPRRRTHATSGDKAQTEKTTTKDYTPAQLEEVKKINKCKDYYEMLGVTKESTDSDIKKAYKKLALKLHPDKNKAPGANEAFKSIGKSVTVLTDPEKRKAYDMYGDSEERVSRMSSQNQGSNAAHYHEFGFESNLTPEDIFNMFFPTYGNHPSYQRRTFTRTFNNNRAQESNQPESSSSIILQILPIIILILISMMSSLFITDPAYNLQPSTKYPVPRATQKLNVPYYVKESFGSEYQGSLHRLELNVEEDYINQLRNMCYREKNRRDTLLWKARNFGDNDLYRQANDLKMPSCDAFRDLSARM
uniref:DnaJ homolog subfamily B member 12 n=1 Tax=Cacopsylla melanoneura TaxID=428564 RepID=A0A8D8Y1Z5_9HEMI